MELRIQLLTSTTRFGSLGQLPVSQNEKTPQQDQNRVFLVRLDRASHLRHLLILVKIEVYLTDIIALKD